MTRSSDISELTILRELAPRYPTIDLALARVAILRAELSLQKGVVHVISDVHGEYKKLRHVVNNASGTLRSFVRQTFENRMSEDEQRELLAVLYYPRETMEHLRTSFADDAARRLWVKRTLRHQFEIVRGLARSYSHEHVRTLFPPEHLELFEELFLESSAGRGKAYIDAVIDALALYERDLTTVRAASRLVRNLTIAELIVAGDLGDRGARIDRVIEYLIQQPRVSIVWGNHDASWMGACLGQEALIATVLRLSLRYRRLFQLEEGYGLILSPLERLARTIYADDPAESFKSKASGLRDDLLMARMQKAIAIIQFKLEGQTIRRHPEWDMENRNLLHRIDYEAGTVEIDGRTYTMRDTRLPTVEAHDPYALSPEEQECMSRLRESFTTSARLWEHQLFVVKHGTMWTHRDDALIFHGCVPVDAAGAPLKLLIDGVEQSGRALFDAMESMIRRAFRRGAEAVGDDADWLWYFWAGARSPLFGKDLMTTFERYFVADKGTHVETKNPYFDLIHDREFCRRVCREFGMQEDGLIVNGHIPVKVEAGEQPVKRSGNAVTIDGAFSEAYGDRGFTLILAPERIALAEHYHFESIADAITEGADIVPKVTTVRAYDKAHTVADTEQGEIVRRKIAALERLIFAYEQGEILEN